MHFLGGFELVNTTHVSLHCYNGHCANGYALSLAYLVDVDIANAMHTYCCDLLML